MKQLFILILIASISISFCACRDESSTIGGKWLESSFLNVQADTFTVSLSTIVSDSLATSGDTVCQIGRHKDYLYGEIKASFYAEYTVPDASLEEETDYKFDSITFKWYSSGNYLGDTLVQQRIDLYALSEQISLETNGYLYNRSTVPYNKSKLLASVPINATPGRKSEKHEYRLPDALGKEWFQRFVDDDESVESQERFREYFKGIAFIPDGQGSTINGFQVNDSSLCITIYYHELKENSSEQTLIFNASSTLAFNKVEHDRSGTPIAGLKSGVDNPLPSSKSNHQVYLQGLTGMYINIDFPYLNDLNQLGRLVSVESAILKLYPIRGTYGDKYPLPASLTLYTANQDNVTQEVITDLSGNSVQTGNLTIDDIYYESTHYSFDITSFIQSNLGTAGQSRNKLQLLLPDNLFFTTVTGVVFGDNQNSGNSNGNNIKLTLLYKTYTK